MMVKFDMIGGRTCLDFVNTGSQRRVGPFMDKLASYDDLLSWAVQAEQLTPSEAVVLREKATRDPAGAAAVLDRARALREAIYRVFAARSDGAALPPDDLQLISSENARASTNRVLT